MIFTEEFKEKSSTKLDFIKTKFYISANTARKNAETDNKHQ
jgi:hypothetical protein